MLSHGRKRAWIRSVALDALEDDRSSVAIHALEVNRSSVALHALEVSDNSVALRALEVNRSFVALHALEARENGGGAPPTCIRDTCRLAPSTREERLPHVSVSDVVCVCEITRRPTPMGRYGTQYS